MDQKECFDDPAILIDSTGMPNSIHFPLTAISNHNGKISKEVRMTTVIQRDSGYPLMFRLVPGNVTDMPMVTRSILALDMHGIETDFVLMNAGYFTNDNINELYEANIDYLTRLPERNRKLYQSIINEKLGQLKQKDNLVKCNGRAVYIASTECKVGNKNHPAYAYLRYDVDRASDEIHKASERLARGKISTDEFQTTLEQAGLFILISSLPFKNEEILPLYYIRQTIE